eukprot:TRINITY_DN16032_c0_g1_i1.p1 TRINITY_DN16032_c0_g1~~TRINITY_DN16032_c0_g1_i1.p1  ORF type:complete len:162 (-),score=49.87 TRINITY_DN16032_c0_g1_i1:168-653(-)
MVARALLVSLALLALALLSVSASHSMKKKAPVRWKRISKPDRCPGRVEDGDLVELFYNVDLKNGERVMEMQDNIGFINGRMLRNGLPSGLHEAALGMCRGEKRKVRLLPQAAYGDQGVPGKGIEPGTTVIIELKLVDIFKKAREVENPDAEDLTQYVKLKA